MLLNDLCCLLMENFMFNRRRIISCNFSISTRDSSLVKIFEYDNFPLDRCVAGEKKVSLRLPLLFFLDGVINGDQLQNLCKTSSLTRLAGSNPMPHYSIDFSRKFSLPIEIIREQLDPIQDPFLLIIYSRLIRLPSDEWR